METRDFGTIGGRLKELRARSGLTQEQVAQELNFGNKGMVSAFETGRRDLSMGALIAYSNYFDVSTDWILTGMLRGCPECIPGSQNASRK